MTHHWMRCAGVALLSVAPLAACGDDAEEADEPTTTESTADQAALAEFCAVAEEHAALEGFPSADQARTYATVAPAELDGTIDVVAAPFVEHEGDDVALLAALADDDVEDAFRTVNDFETEHCGIDNSDVTTEDVAVDGTANRVDVIAAEYSFELPDTIPAGPTSLVLTNEGDEAHFMLIFQLAEGHTMEEALEFEGDPQEAGLVTDFELESGLAAPGGDVEVINADLEPGSYAMLCFIPGPEGIPHAFTGMAAPFTVS